VPLDAPPRSPSPQRTPAARLGQALSFTSYTGIGAVAFTAFVVLKRWLDGTYAAGGAIFAAGLPYAPALGQLSAWRVSAGTFVLFNMLSTAYMAHTNAVRFYTELKDTSPRRFATVCASGFGAAAVAHALVMVAGYATFGAASQGLILNNFHLTADGLARAARVATGLSILGSHPLLFTSLRDSVLSALAGSKLGKAAESSAAVWTGLSVAMLSAATVLAIVATDVGFVASVSGASLGAVLIFVVPALMQLATMRAANGGKAVGAKAVGAKAIVGFGAVMAVLGTTVTCLETFTTVFR
jgi:sodium-coupled neutral amino acid transporter 11